MGRKITIDSATMVNKGLEVIEAKWLFDVEPEQIEVIVQPQSIIHSMVEFIDGSVVAQLGLPDMKLPIQYALFYPERVVRSGEKLDFRTIGKITCEAPDLEYFRGLSLAYRAIKSGGRMPAVFNAANEWAVAMFLRREISFLEITEVIEAAMGIHKIRENPSLDAILAAEQETYEYMESRWR
jgi:1-deoxy-D-xylulose-5-phosphate reductoisomerase